MDNGQVDEGVLATGGYCHKRVAGCFCAVGWPVERQCPKCRDLWVEGAFRFSYCVCPPDDDEREKP